MNFEHCCKCFDFTNVPEKRPGQETGTCTSQSGPLECTPDPYCMPGCVAYVSPWGQLGVHSDAAHHQHLSESPGTPRATGRPSINTTSSPDLPPGLPPYTFFFVLLLEIMEKRRTENRKDGESPLKTVLCVFGDTFTGHDLCWHRHCLLLFRDSSELLCITFLIVIIYFFFFRVVQLINYICFLKFFFGVWLLYSVVLVSTV